MWKVLAGVGLLGLYILGWLVGKGELLGIALALGIWLAWVATVWGQLGLYLCAVASLIYPVQLAVVSQPLAPLVGEMSLVESAVVAWALTIGFLAVVHGGLRRSLRHANPRLGAVAGCFLAVALVFLGWLFTVTVAPLGQTDDGFRRVLVCLCVFLLGVRVVNSDRRARLVIVAALVPLAVTLLYMLVSQYIVRLPFALVDSQTGVTARFYAGYALPRAREVVLWATWAGTPAAVVALAGVLWIIAGREFGRRALGLGLFLAGGAVLLSTQGRAAWAAFALGLLFALWLGWKVRLWSAPRVFLGGLLSCVALVALVVTGVIGAQILDRASSFLSAAEDTSFAVHWELWKTSIHLWAENPLTGAGYGAVSQQTQNLLYEHSAYLAALNGLGLVGCAGLVLLYVMAGTAAWRVAKRGGQDGFVGVVGLGVLVVVLVGGIAEDVPFSNPQCWAVWGAVVGLACVAKTRGRSGIASALGAPTSPLSP